MRCNWNARPDHDFYHIITSLVAIYFSGTSLVDVKVGIDRDEGGYRTHKSFKLCHHLLSLHKREKVTE